MNISPSVGNYDESETPQLKENVRGGREERSNLPPSP